MKKIFFLKAISDWCLPPKIKNFLGNFIKGKKNWYFKGNYNSWNEAVKYSTGYADEKILNRVLESALKVKNGEAVFERDSVLFDEIQYSWPLLSGLLWSAALQKNELNILSTSVIEFILYEIKPYVNIAILFIVCMFIMNLAILVMISILLCNKQTINRSIIKMI